jgi:hypothetical protein
VPKQQPWPTAELDPSKRQIENPTQTNKKIGIDGRIRFMGCFQGRGFAMILRCGLKGTAGDQPASRPNEMPRWNPRSIET